MVCGAEEEAGGGENREWSVEEREEKDTVEGEKKSCMKEDISNRPSCLREQRWCGGSCSLFLCTSISISYLIDKACGVLNAGPGPKASLLSLRGAQSHWYGGLSFIMVMPHFAPTLPHITGLGLLASTHTNTAALHMLY